LYYDPSFNFSETNYSGMQRKHYTIVLTLVIAFTLVAGDLMAQRGRYYRGPYRSYYPRYVPARPFIASRPFLSIHFGGMRYRYQHGFFYRPVGGMISLVFPPVGIRIRTLPPGYRRVYVGPDPYYYYNGIYYRSRPDREFEVVAPPMGAEVHRLPPGAKATVINGKKYYEMNGTYYEETISEENVLYYRVVGTDGVLITTTESEFDDQGEGYNEEDSLSQHDGGDILRLGDRLEQLPTDSKEVFIDGVKYYSTPSGYYYREVKEGNRIFYELVGK
jgi:hypothetical protein